MTSVIRTMTEVGGWVWPSRILFVLKLPTRHTSDWRNAPISSVTTAWRRVNKGYLSA